MRSIFFALLTIAAVGVVGAAPAVAVGTRYPFCLQGNEFPALSNCTFSSAISSVRPALQADFCKVSPTLTTSQAPDEGARLAAYS